MTETLTKGERTRSEIVETAHLLFLKNGYHGTSMRQIADGTGIALGGIYNHFESKEDIFEAVVLAKHPYHEIIPALKEAEGETSEELIRNMMERVWGNVNERDDVLNLLFIEMVEFNGQHVPKLFAILFPEFLGFAKSLYKTRSELRDIPLPNFVRALVSTLIGFMFTEQLMGKHFPKKYQKTVLDDTINIFLHGALAQSQDSKA